jgi:hypothetical protein
VTGEDLKSPKQFGNPKNGQNLILSKLTNYHPSFRNCYKMGPVSNYQGTRIGFATILFVSTFIFVSQTSLARSVDSTNPTCEYKTVFIDHFNSLDLSNWNIVSREKNHNEELQFYTDRKANVRVEGGMLVITPREENFGEKKWTSGRVTGKNKRSFKYGRFTVRAKLPSGLGLWSAIWMMPQGERVQDEGASYLASSLTPLFLQMPSMANGLPLVRSTLWRLMVVGRAQRHQPCTSATSGRTTVTRAYPLPTLSMAPAQSVKMTCPPTSTITSSSGPRPQWCFLWTMRSRGKLTFKETGTSTPTRSLPMTPSDSRGTNASILSSTALWGVGFCKIRSKAAARTGRTLRCSSISCRSSRETVTMTASAAFVSLTNGRLPIP